MKIDEIAELIKNNWYIIIAVAVFLIPIIWIIVHFLYRNRLDELKAKLAKIKFESTMKDSPIPKPENAQSKTGEPYCENFKGSSLLSLFPISNPLSQNDLEDRMTKASKRITIFGLTRNFLVTEKMRELLIKKSLDVPIVFFLMDPDCDSRKDRYRLEPIEASLEDPGRFKREVVLPLNDLCSKTNRTSAGSNTPGFTAYYYNFPCSFAIEEFDDTYRVMLYGHGKRGTEGPIFVFKGENQFAAYFSSQLRWLERLAISKTLPPWSEKGLKVTPLF